MDRVENGVSFRHTVVT